MSMQDVFAADGPLARSLPRYAPRAAQLRMAEAVAEAIAERQHLVVEAGTGTGKTFAYLAPALLSGRRVVVSTGTLNLQDQLFYRDLPLLLQALGTPARVSLLKGRANYVCRYRLEQALHQPGLRRDAERLQRLRRWVQGAEEGELSQANLITAQEPLAARVSSTADNCLGSRCPEFERCFVVKARRAAQAADVVVVNHHLLMADFALKEEGFGQILPGADAVIVDEAHQLPEIGSRFFGTRLSTGQLRDLAQDVYGEARSCGDLPDLEATALELERQVLQLEQLLPPPGTRESLASFLARGRGGAALSAMSVALDAVLKLLQAYAPRSAGLEHCAQRAADKALALQVMTAGSDDQQVRWLESSGRGAQFSATPTELAEGFRNLRAVHTGGWVFTSATLAIGQDFSHFCRELGLEEARTLHVSSPYDFAAQARLYLPPRLPEPQDDGHTDAVVDAVLPLLRASGGGAFLLCTSHRALRRAAERLRREQSLPLFVQGEGPRRELLAAFAADGNGVLVGTQSFWEGVDVRGPALRLVIIDKLPFAAPGDPVFEARLRAIRERGGEPFREYQLPQAIMTLRQGMGRLIRDVDDRGLLVLCDPRVRSRGYGRQVLRSLPAMPVLTEEAEALAWLQGLHEAGLQAAAL